MPIKLGELSFRVNLSQCRHLKKSRELVVEGSIHDYKEVAIDTILCRRDSISYVVDYLLKENVTDTFRVSIALPGQDRVIVFYDSSKNYGWLYEADKF